MSLLISSNLVNHKDELKKREQWTHRPQVRFWEVTRALDDPGSLGCEADVHEHQLNLFPR